MTDMNSIWVKDQKKWDLWFLHLCDAFALKSKDPSTRVGAMIVDSNNVLVMAGYNGFAQRCEDKEEYYTNREVKYLRVIHAEMNCLIFARRDITGCTLYTTPIPPCAPCTAMFIQAGVSRFVSYDNDIDNPRWVASFAEAARMRDEAQVMLDLYHKEVS